MLHRFHRLCTGDLNKRILDATRARIRAGETTERTLAEITYQPATPSPKDPVRQAPASKTLAIALAFC